MLQAGAFFGALGSAPVSGQLRLNFYWPPLIPNPKFTAKIGRRLTLLGFSVVFLVGAVSLLIDPSLVVNRVVDTYDRRRRS